MAIPIPRQYIWATVSIQQTILRSQEWRKYLPPATTKTTFEFTVDDFPSLPSPVSPSGNLPSHGSLAYEVCPSPGFIGMLKLRRSKEMRKSDFHKLSEKIKATRLFSEK